MLKLHGSIGTAVSLLFVLSLSAILVSAVGCSDSGPALYTVTGSVSFEGTPVEEGAIAFEDPALGHADMVELGSGGTYTIKLREGDYLVGIAPPEVAVTGEGAPAGYTDFAEVDNIPEKYWDGSSSGLTAQVSEDKSGLDFDMTP